MKRERNPFKIPKAGLEVAAIGTIRSIKSNLNNSNLSNRKVLARSTLSGIAIHSTYQALLAALRTEALFNRGSISRKMQLKMIIQSLYDSAKSGFAISALLGIILLVFPWLNFPISVLSVLGASTASFDLFNAFWDGLDKSQQANLLSASMEAGVNLRRVINTQLNSRKHAF